MKRIQFYPGRALEAKLDEEALRLGVSVSTMVVDLLNELYGLVPKNTLSLTQATTQVLDEVTEYINTLNVNDEFDLLSASDSFKNIDMISSGKPSAIRASIGRSFSKNIGTDRFSNIEIAYRSDGKVKKTNNNATIYKVVNV
jgi:hypothetical protein